MKITGYAMKEKEVVIHTDNELYPVYTFKISEFNSVAKIKQELERKIEKKKNKKDKLQLEKEKIIAELEKEVGN